MPPVPARRGKVRPFPIMKTQTTRRPHETQPARHHPRNRPQSAPTIARDPLAQQIRDRRLYTDFLVLALYPGMTPGRAP